MDKCKNCNAEDTMDMVPDVFTPHLQCRVCRDIVYLTLDGDIMQLRPIGDQSLKYADVRHKVEYLIDKGLENSRIAKILELTPDIIYRGSRAYRIKTGKINRPQSQRKRAMAGAAR